MDPSDIETIMQASDLDLTFSVVELGQENEEILAHLPSMRHYNNRQWVQVRAIAGAARETIENPGVHTEIFGWIPIRKTPEGFWGWAGLPLTKQSFTVSGLQEYYAEIWLRIVVRYIHGILLPSLGEAAYPLPPGYPLPPETANPDDFDDILGDVDMNPNPGEPEPLLPRAHSLAELHLSFT